MENKCIAAAHHCIDGRRKERHLAVVGNFKLQRDCNISIFRILERSNKSALFQLFAQCRPGLKPEFSLEIKGLPNDQRNGVTDCRRGKASCAQRNDAAVILKEDLHFAGWQRGSKGVSRVVDKADRNRRSELAVRVVIGCCCLVLHRERYSSSIVEWIAQRCLRRKIQRSRECESVVFKGRFWLVFRLRFSRC